MELLARIAQVIVPVFLVVGIGYVYARRQRPDMVAFNRIVLDLLSPLLVYTALAGKEFQLREHLPLLAGGALLILATGAVAWVVSRASAKGTSSTAARPTTSAARTASTTSEGTQTSTFRRRPLLRRRTRQTRASTPARCIPRSSSTGRGAAPSAAWRSSLAS